MFVLCLFVILRAPTVCFVLLCPCDVAQAGYNSLCGLGWPRTYCVSQTGLILLASSQPPEGHGMEVHPCLSGVEFLKRPEELCYLSQVLGFTTGCVSAVSP